MKTSQHGIFLNLFLSRHANAAPLSEQLYAQIKDLVSKGFLAPGDLLPPSRHLSVKLGIGRNTVVRAYQQLVQEGFAYSQVGHGTRISESFLQRTSVEQKSHDDSFVRHPKMALNSRAEVGESTYRIGVDPELPFSLMSPDLQTIPGKKWVQLVTRCQKIPWRHNGFSMPEGIPDYRQAVAKTLKEHRGIVCDYQQVVAVSNIRQGLALCAQLLFEPGDEIAVENPGYQVHHNLLRFYGLKLIPIPVTDNGLDLTTLFSLEKPPKAVLVAPNNQFPTTAVMSENSRKALEEWANLKNCWIIEDDYDGHISHEKYPSPSIAVFDPLWTNTNHLGSFSKSIYPGFKLGYMVMNRSLVKAFAGARLFSDRQCCENHEVVLANFINEGNFESHLRKLRNTLNSRRNVLLAELEKNLTIFGKWKVPKNGGHICFEFYQSIDDVTLSAFLKQKYRIVCRPLSPQYLTNDKKFGFILGFSGFSEEALIRAVGVLKKGIVDFIQNTPSYSQILPY